jgi:hypothetical protein
VQQNWKATERPLSHLKSAIPLPGTDIPAAECRNFNESSWEKQRLFVTFFDAPAMENQRADG